MDFNIVEKVINLNINQETKTLEIVIEDNHKELELEFTNYNDKEVKKAIKENTETIEELEENKADKTEIKTKTSELINDSNFVSDPNYKHTDNNYTNQEKNKLADLQNYDDTEIKEELAGKQPKGNYALKSEIPDVSQFITASVNNLVNYYLKSDTYSKAEVNTLIGQIQTASIEVVQSLPATGQTNVIYFVPKDIPNTDDIYNEFIYINNTWEKIGNTQVDLTGYATETWVNTQIADFLTQTQIQALINTALSNHYTKTETDTLLAAKADYGFYGVIDGTSADPTDGATLPNGVYKASENQNTSYISLDMEDGTTKKQSVQKGGIVIRTTARLLIFATQSLMYQYDTSNDYFYPAESYIESNLRRKYDDGLAYLGTVSPPNNVFITTPITELEATINTGDTGHVKIWFTVDNGVAEGDFYLGLTDTEGNDLIYADGATPKPVSGETWILEFYGNTCEAICFKETDGKSKEDLLKQFMRRNSNQIYYPSIDGQPNFSVQKAAGNSDDPDRRVVITPSDVTLTSFQNLGYYGIDDTKIPLDLSLYDVSQQANQLHPYTQLPDGVYTVTRKGRLYLDAGDIKTYVAQPGETIYKDNTELIIIGYYAGTYFSWNSTDEVYEGGYFTTTDDVAYMLEDYEKGYTVSKSSTATGSIAMNDHRWTRKTRETGVNALTLNYPNVTTIEDTYEARFTGNTSSTFTAVIITARSYAIRHIGDDCVDGELTMVAGKYYDIEAKADGFGGIVGIVHSYTLPTT